jgi:hypothetical protein
MISQGRVYDHNDGHGRRLSTRDLAYAHASQRLSRYRSFADRLNEEQIEAIESYDPTDVGQTVDS